MPIRRPDTYRHNNSDLPIVLPFDWQVGAGVSVITDLYNIPPDKINVGGEVYVESEDSKYKLIDRATITSSSGWEKMYSGTQVEFQNTLDEKVDITTYNSDKHFKGLFTSEANLISATSTMDPAPKTGDYAKVDEGVGFDVVKYIWDNNDSKWIIGGGSGTVESVNGVTPDVDGNIELQILSAYDVWLSEGNAGTVQDYLDSLIGPKGDSAYQVWLNAGNTGTEQDFLYSLILDDSLEGYRVSVNQFDNEINIPFKDSKYSFTGIDLIPDLSSFVAQLYKVQSGEIIGMNPRNTLTNLNSDINLMTSQELTDGYFVKIIFNLIQGKDQGAAIIKVEKL